MKAMSLQKDSPLVRTGINGKEADVNSAAWTGRLIAEFDAADQKAQELVTGLSQGSLTDNRDEENGVSLFRDKALFL